MIITLLIIIALTTITVIASAIIFKKNPVITYPTETPTYYPTETPTYYPTETPTYYPTETPTYYPTETPTYYPTEAPTYYPTNTPTISPISFEIPGPIQDGEINIFFMNTTPLYINTSNPIVVSFQYNSIMNPNNPTDTQPIDIAEGSVNFTIYNQDTTPLGEYASSDLQTIVDGNTNIIYDMMLKFNSLSTPTPCFSIPPNSNFTINFENFDSTVTTSFTNIFITFMFYENQNC